MRKLPSCDDPHRYALDGGEDFGLLVAVRPRAFAHLANAYAKHFGRPLFAIGRLTAEPGLRSVEPLETRELVAAGWDHFTSEAGTARSQAP